MIPKRDGNMWVIGLAPGVATVSLALDNGTNAILLLHWVKSLRGFSTTKRVFGLAISS